MGYRHYVGYIPKKDLPEILKEVEELKVKIGQPKENEPEEVYSDYDVTRFMRGKAIELLNLGKLYWKSQQGIYDLLYKNKTEDFSNEDTEFFLINDDRFLYNLSVECQKIWTNCLKEYKDTLKKVINLDKVDMNTKCNLPEIYELFDSEIRELETAIEFNKIAEEENSKFRDLAPYNQWQYNYIAVEYFLKHKEFDYENNQLCVFAY